LLNANLAGAGRATRADQSHFAAAFGLHEQGRDVEALKELQLALEYDSASNVLTLQATLLQKTGDFAGAERAARAATRLYPQEADVWADLGNVFANGRMLDSAARYFGIALERDPYSLQAWSTSATSASSAGTLPQPGTTTRVRSSTATYVDAIFYLGLCDYYQGNVSGAHAPGSKPSSSTHPSPRPNRRWNSSGRRRPQASSSKPSSTDRESCFGVRRRGCRLSVPGGRVRR